MLLKPWRTSRKSKQYFPVSKGEKQVEKVASIEKFFWNLNKNY